MRPEHIASLVLFVRDDGKVLLGEKKTAQIGTGTLNGPGGKLESQDNGNLKTCAVREVKAEWNLDINATDLSLTAKLACFAGPRFFFEVHVFLYCCSRATFLMPQETDHMRIPSWYYNWCLPYERMLEADRKWFSRAVSGEQFLANVHYKNEAKDLDYIIFFPFPDVP